MTPAVTDPHLACRSCGAALVFAHDADTGRPLAFDAAPVHGGAWSIRDRGGVLVAGAIGSVSGGLGWTPHTCTRAEA